MKATAVIKKVGGVSGTVGSAPSVSASLTKVGGASVIVDPALDPTSANPVENKAIAEAIEEINGNLTSLDAAIDDLMGELSDSVTALSGQIYGKYDASNPNGYVDAAQAANAAPVQSVNGQTGTVSLSIPTRTSDLTNNSGFITAAGAPVQSVNGETGAVTVSVPTNVSQLTNDSGFVNASGAATASPVQSVNGQTGAVALTIPTVPTNVSAFTNDAGYITLADLPVYSGGVQ